MKTALKLLKKFNDVKTLPHVAIRLSQLVADENSPIKEFEKIIKMDPTLVMRLLRLEGMIRMSGEAAYYKSATRFYFY